MIIYDIRKMVRKIAGVGEKEGRFERRRRGGVQFSAPNVAESPLRSSRPFSRRFDLLLVVDRLDRVLGLESGEGVLAVDLTKAGRRPDLVDDDPQSAGDYVAWKRAQHKDVRIKTEGEETRER